MLYSSVRSSKFCEKIKKRNNEKRQQQQQQQHSRKRSKSRVVAHNQPLNMYVNYAPKCAQAVARSVGRLIASTSIKYYDHNSNLLICLAIGIEIRRKYNNSIQFALTYKQPSFSVWFDLIFSAFYFQCLTQCLNSGHIIDANIEFDK